MPSLFLHKVFEKFFDPEQNMGWTDEVLQYRRVFNTGRRAAPFPLIEATRLVINICSKISVC